MICALTARQKWHQMAEHLFLFFLMGQLGHVGNTPKLVPNDQENDYRKGKCI